MKQKSKLLGLILILTITIIDLSCKHPNAVKHNGEKDLISFKPVFGINYTEVSRRLKNGLSFNEYGYQLEPQWKMSFVSDDSARVYSPIKKQFINFPLTRGYDSIFNTARAWLKVKKMNKDSLVMEILKSHADSIETTGAKVFMTFYADDYVKNVLHSDTATLRRPSKKDTLYIRSLVAAANSNLNKAFAARQPVIFISKSPSVTVKQQTTEADLFNNFDASDDYLDPTYNITINKAYANFYYSFAAYVDEKGQMHYVKPLVPFIDQSIKDNYIHLSQAVMNSYLKFYLQIIPGKTLSIPHSSLITLHVEGKTGA
jgi:hypothetical protein